MNYPFAPPRKPARFSPIIVLFFLALLPAAGLAYLWQFAHQRIPKQSAASATTDGETPATTVPVAPPALRTPILSVRRAPETLAALSNTDAFRAALQGIAGFVDSTSCLVVSLNGKTVLDVGGDRAVVPASNMKLLTAAVALETLGADYTYTTSVKGAFANGTVTGDLYLVGGGDPVLSTAAYPATQTHPPTSTTSLEQLAQNLVAAGVQRVTGTVVGDESRYDAERFVPTWGSDVPNLQAGPLGALMVNDATKKIGALPPQRYADPAIGAATDFIAVLKAAGIKFGGGAPKNGVAPPDAAEIASIKSAPLAAIVGEMLNTSDDNTAELMVKEIGKHFDPAAGGNRLSGLDAVKRTLVTWGIDTQRLTLADASGLDASDTVTCNLILALLQRPGVIAGPIGQSLPIAGQTGTLNDEFVGSPIAGRLHAKTGTLNSAKALSGYVSTNGGEIDFSLILNTPGVGADPARAYVNIWASLANVFAAYPAGPTADQIMPP